MRSVTLASTSRSEDAALQALRDASLAISGLAEACIIGGQMTALLSAAFGRAATIARRTMDADAAVSPTIAAAGSLHDLLTDRGYRAQASNRYVLDDRVIDVLVPATSGAFEPAEYGGRSFDSAPGLHLALVGMLDLEVTAILLDGTPVRFRTRVPGVERALIVKALAYESGRRQKDLVDLFNLLSIRDEYEPAEVGGWRIGESAGTGARRDAAAVLRRLAGARGLRMILRGSDVPDGRFVSLLRSYISQG